ncbi:hypothetical protein pb186bvf_005130 [Paramecium bursaria]
MNQDLETGLYWIQGQLKNKLGKDQPKFQLGITGFPRKEHVEVQYTNMYTPHQDKFHGYCQFPMAPIKKEKLQTRQSSRYTRKLYSTVKNAFNKPKTLYEDELVVEQKFTEDNIQQQANYLTGSIADTRRTVQTERIPVLNYRKLTKSLDLRKAPIYTDRVVCKIINDRKIVSPEFSVINKMEPKQQMIQREPFHRPLLQEPSNYQSLDLSLNQDSVEFDYMRRSTQIREKNHHKTTSLDPKERERIDFYYFQNKCSSLHTSRRLSTMLQGSTKFTLETINRKSDKF